MVSTVTLHTTSVAIINGCVVRILFHFWERDLMLYTSKPLVGGWRQIQKELKRIRLGEVQTNSFFYIILLLSSITTSIFTYFHCTTFPHFHSLFSKFHSLFSTLSFSVISKYCFHFRSIESNTISTFTFICFHFQFNNVKISRYCLGCFPIILSQLWLWPKRTAVNLVHMLQLILIEGFDGRGADFYTLLSEPYRTESCGKVLNVTTAS